MEDEEQVRRLRALCKDLLTRLVNSYLRLIQQILLLRERVLMEPANLLEDVSDGLEVGDGQAQYVHG